MSISRWHSIPRFALPYTPADFTAALWAILEGAPLRFDPIAAFAPLDTSVVPFDLNSFHSQRLATTFNDVARTPLPDRGPYTTGNGIPFTTGR